MYNNNSSGAIAKNRLKYLILTDRVSCTRETLDMIKQDVIKTVSNYIDIDKYNTKLTLDQDKNMSCIEIKLPIKQTGWVKWIKEAAIWTLCLYSAL